jgi:hypothetical protein
MLDSRRNAECDNRAASACAPSVRKNLIMDKFRHSSRGHPATKAGTHYTTQSGGDNPRSDVKNHTGDMAKAQWSATLCGSEEGRCGFSPIAAHSGAAGAYTFEKKREIFKAANWSAEGRHDGALSSFSLDLPGLDCSTLS